MLTVTFSNRFENLLDALLSRMNASPPAPFIAEQIVVPSAAIRRKLELTIADRRGICSNVVFSFLGFWVLEQALGLQNATSFSTGNLSWRIFRIFEDAHFVAQHPRLASWFNKMADPVMRYELALRVAPLMEQYALYRPEWLQIWSDNATVLRTTAASSAEQDQAWQAALWRRITNELDAQHPWVTMQQWLKSTSMANTASGTAHIFCPPTLAPLYVETLHKLGQSMDIHLYLFNPCREYWFDIVSPRRISYLQAHGQADYHVTGNSLLATWGRQNQAMLELLFADETLTSHENSHFTSNLEKENPNTLLSCVQDAILDLQELAPNSVPIHDGDRSLEIHVCHSLTRELEVLQDQLLAYFADDNPPLPGDVLVVTPDLEQAAPLIDAVFSAAPRERRIPYTIAGRKGSHENPLTNALFDLLALASSRFLASDVFNLLQQPVIARRFGLKETDLEQIHDWMIDAGIRWGLDAGHRKQFDLPENDRYSFGDGFHRLFLGYALPDNSNTPFGKRLPAGNPEGSQAIVLGKFWQFLQQFTKVQQQLKAPQTPNQWLRILATLVERFMLPIHNELDDQRDMQHKIQAVCRQMQQCCPSHPITLEVVQKALTDHFDDAAGAAIPTGMVTFSTMNGLRNLPYRMICIIGLNDGAFPGNNRPAEFDLMTKPFRLGDRQRRNDDRNLFLDLLLAARERLYLSYVGRSVRNNETMPPSVLVSDLLDYLIPAIALDDQEARNRLLVTHPLQPFSMRYFEQTEDTRLRSSHREYYEVLKDKLRHQPQVSIKQEVDPESRFDEESEEGTDDENVQVFFTTLLSAPDEAWRSVSLDQLLRFFRNPSRYLLQRRLGVSFPEQVEELPDEEPFLPAWEEKNSLGDRILPMYLSGASEDMIQASAVAGPEYPPGKFGEALLNKELHAMDAYAQEWRALSSQSTLPTISGTLSFSIDGESWQLSGSFNDLRPEGLLRHRFDETRPTDYLAGWIQHLFLNAIAPEGVQRQTLWHSRNGRYLLKPVKNAEEELQKLLVLYRHGLSEPLHFYPKSAWAYAANNWNLRKAGEKWQNARNEAFGESHNPDFRQALRGIPDPLDERFEDCAKQVFTPLLQHIEDDRLTIDKDAQE